MIGSRSIARRVALAFGLIVAISAASSAFVVIESLAVRHGVHNSSEHATVRNALAKLQEATDRAHRAMLVLINSSDVALRPNYEEALDAVGRAEEELARVVSASQTEDGQIAATALDKVRSGLEAWQAEIAAKQIADLDDPSTVDVARLREVSTENRAIWDGIHTAFSDALQHIEHHLEDSSVEQEQELTYLLIVTSASGVIVVLVSTFMALLLSRTVARPLRQLAGVTERLKDRDWSVTIGTAHLEDEIGLMSRALEVFRESGRRGEAMEAERRAEADRKLAEAAAIAEAVARFRSTATELLTDLDGAGRSLGGAAHSLENVAGTSHAYTASVSRAAEATGSSVESVASAVEEMSASIREISAQMQNVSRLTRDATGASEAAGRKVAGLKKMSENINSVIGLINGIAGQINLLALNATIESARAGDAGKGFAVVASQVKQLADQTAKATDEITRVINEVQGEVAEVVGVIGKIGGSISEVSTNCAAVAAAVEEQSAALDEITHNVTAVSSQTNNVATNVRGVEEKVSETLRVASTVSQLSAELKTSSEGLSGTIERFIGAVANDTGSTGRAA